MADAIIDIVGPGELPLIAQLYNKIFRPGAMRIPFVGAFGAATTFCR